MNEMPVTSSEKWENIYWKVMNPEWPGFCNKERNVHVHDVAGWGGLIRQFLIYISRTNLKPESDIFPLLRT